MLKKFKLIFCVLLSFTSKNAYSTDEYYILESNPFYIKYNGLYPNTTYGTEFQIPRVSISQILNSPDSFQHINDNFAETSLDSEWLKVFSNLNTELSVFKLAEQYKEIINCIKNKNVSKLIEILYNYPDIICQLEAKDWFDNKLNALHRNYIYKYIYNELNNITPESINNILNSINKIEVKYNIKLENFVQNKIYLYVNQEESQNYLKVIREIIFDLKQDPTALIIFTCIVYGIDLEKHVSPSGWHTLASYHKNNIKNIQKLINKLGINISIDKIVKLNNITEYLNQNKVNEIWAIIKNNPNILKLDSYCKRNYRHTLLNKIAQTLVDISDENYKKTIEVFSNFKKNKDIDITALIKFNKTKPTTSKIACLEELLTNIMNTTNKDAKTVIGLMFILSGLDLNSCFITINSEYNLLQLAILINKPALIWLCINFFGIDLTYINKNGYSALDIAKIKNNTYAFNLIHNKQLKSYYATLKSNDIVKMLNILSEDNFTKILPSKFAMLS